MIVISLFHELTKMLDVMDAPKTHTMYWPEKSIKELDDYLISSYHAKLEIEDYPGTKVFEIDTYKFLIYPLKNKKNSDTRPE